MLAAQRTTAGSGSSGAASCCSSARRPCAPGQAVATTLSRPAGPAPVNRTRAAVGHHAESHDVVLSSGFLAFAQHSGFLQAVEEAGITVGGVMGTSAGALAGSLYAAGYSPREVAAALGERAPINFLKPSLQPWRGGVLSLDNVVDRLRELLPPTFDDLERDFAVGVVTGDGAHALIDQGPLPEAVAASAAIPFVFSNVDVPGVLPGLKDGGVVDRVGLAAWRQRRRQQQHFGRRGARLPPCLVHVIERSSPFSGADDAEACGEPAVTFVRCPKSGVNFFDLGDFTAQFESARGRAAGRLGEYGDLLRTLQQQQQRAAAAAAAAAASSSSSSSSNANGRARIVASNVLPAKGVVLPSGASSSNNGSSNGSSSSSSSAGALTAQSLVAAASANSGASSAGAAAAPAGLAAARPSPPRGGVRRAVQDDSAGS